MTLNPLNLDRAVMVFAGVINLLALILAYIYTPWWLILSFLVSVGLIQAPLTGFCPPAIFFKKLGIKPGIAFDP